MSIICLTYLLYRSNFTKDEENFIWIFHAASTRFSGGAFSTLESAEQWISARRLTGVLTKYPLDTGVYEWATEAGLFTPRKEAHSTPDFIGGFTSASQEHFPYEDGERE